MPQQAAARTRSGSGFLPKRTAAAGLAKQTGREVDQRGDLCLLRPLMVAIDDDQSRLIRP